MPLDSTSSLTPNRLLKLWHDALLESVRRDTPDLSARQMSVLLAVYVVPPPHTVRGLSSSMNVSKPAITRALDKLCALDFLRRKPDETDRRSIVVQRTVKGSVFLSDFGDSIAESLKHLDD
ncbi:MAG: MarR family transcriptional regulator [Alphaproteobacteria bacterium]|nr:MarR family transcriptional regulator [Alphaproteobacteria bacterium]